MSKEYLYSPEGYYIPKKGHPTLCAEAIFELSKEKFLCPVEVRNFIREYAEQNDYPYQRIVQHGERGFLGRYLQQGVGPKTRDQDIYIGGAFCGRCDQECRAIEWEQTCQICAGTYLTPLRECKADEGEKYIYRRYIESGGEKCQDQLRCEDILLFFVWSRHRSKFPLGTLADKNLIRKRGMIAMVRYLEMMADKKKRKLHEQRKREWEEERSRIRRARKNGQDIGWFEKRIIR